MNENGRARIEEHQRLCCSAPAKLECGVGCYNGVADAQARPSAKCRSRGAGCGEEGGVKRFAPQCVSRFGACLVTP